MFKYKFTISDMEIKHNFYIKEVMGITRESTQYWKYTINFIDYYIPNCGSLLLIDSNYRDLDPKDQFKILSTEFGDDENMVLNMVLKNAIKCLNLDNFTQDFKNAGGVSPPENIKKNLEEINSDLKCMEQAPPNDRLKFFNGILENHLKKNVHNRIGTLIRDSEFKYIDFGDNRPYKPGELVVREIGWFKFEVVLFLKLLPGGLECSVITKNEYNLLIIKNYPENRIKHYSIYEPIKQDIKPGEPALNLDYIIENYFI
jgi:hypothetical protein